MGTVETCTCTTLGNCPLCRPPCMWVTGHLWEVPIRCGDLYFTHLTVNLPVCVSHYEYSRLHAMDLVT